MEGYERAGGRGKSGGGYPARVGMGALRGRCGFRLAVHDLGGEAGHLGVLRGGLEEDEGAAGGFEVG